MVFGKILMSIKISMFVIIFIIMFNVMLKIYLSLFFFFLVSCFEVFCWSFTTFV